MSVKRALWLALAWLLATLLLLGILSRASDRALGNSIERRVQEHLQQSLDESWFSASQSRSNDRRLLLRAGEAINQQLARLVDSAWFAPHQACRVQLLQVDGIVLADALPGLRQRHFGLFRNQIEREVVFGYQCQPGLWFALGVAGLLGLLFLLIALLVPPPLSVTHRRWINLLLEQGYTGQEAFDSMRGYRAGALELNASQQRCLEHLHAPDSRNMAAVLGVVTDPRVAALAPEQVQWFLLGLDTARRGEEPLEHLLEPALVIANTPNSVHIDLPRMQLALRGIPVPVGGTPLFYYAWYALARLQDDGWITNPPSNRPDKDAGARLAELMEQHQGHARAINDLQQAGLRARSLDQNRSKIKEDIVAALGEACADAFLFDSSRHPDGVQLRYRLRIEPSGIRVVTAEGESQVSEK
tara:strand:+ start:7139 stop:8383 length:1245 start_codon:yes stop_codon:yes gene_type:complete